MIRRLYKKACSDFSGRVTIRARRLTVFNHDLYLAVHTAPGGRVGAPSRPLGALLLAGQSDDAVIHGGDDLGDVGRGVPLQYRGRPDSAIIFPQI